MGARGGRHPQGLKQRTLRTLFLRAPYEDWSALVQGTKREFRTPAMGSVAGVIHAPTPVVLYALSPSQNKRRDALVVMTAHRCERLHDISGNKESLAAEGFATYGEFRNYWRARTHRPYRALQQVEVFTVAPWGAMSVEELGVELLSRLYSEYLPTRHQAAA